MAVFFRDRFPAFGFLTVAYNPSPDLNYDVIMAMTESINGYGLIGCMKFFHEDDSTDILEEHVSVNYLLRIIWLVMTSKNRLILS